MNLQCYIDKDIPANHSVYPKKELCLKKINKESNKV